MQQSCRQCQQSFDITTDDLAFYEKVSPVFAGKKELIPPPTLCPECRMQRRWSWRNEHTLYRRRCDLSGEEMISLYSPDAPFKVYREDLWWSDQWDPLSYGREVDLSSSILRQFDTLLSEVPRRGMHQNGTNENCEYTTLGGNNKNCYMAFACLNCEDVLYGWRVMLSKDALDCFLCIGGEMLYECLDCTQCYRCFFCQDSYDCQDSLFLDHCSNCSNCIGCKNLRNKEFHIHNKPVTPAAFAAYRETLLSSPAHLQEERTALDTLKKQLPSPFMHARQSEDATGDNLDQAKRCHQCFDILQGGMDCRYCQFCGGGGRDMMDCTMAGMQAELLYEVHAVAVAQQCICTTFGNDLVNVCYGDCMKNCSDCFACTGLKHKQYCILNKQYTKEEYEELVPKIIEKMRTTPLRPPGADYAGQEWGEFFPVTMSPFAYNETVAQEYFPMTKEEVLARGWKWRDQTDEMPKVDKIIPASQLPDSIDDIPDDILNWAIVPEGGDPSASSGPSAKRPFKIIKQELEFYRQMRLPVPRLHPDERHRRRMALRNPRKLWDRECAKCHKPIATSYAPERPEIVYCEECYLKEVY